MTSESPAQSQWGLDDLAVMLGALAPAILVSVLLTRGLKFVLPRLFAERYVEAFLFQSAFYLLTIGALYFVVTVKRQRPFFESLAWTSRFPGAAWCVVLGFGLMFATSGLGYWLKAPIIPNPWQELITGKASQVTVILFAAILGPIWEELLFRGFLYPLLAERVGPWPAILGSAIPFGLIHGAQNEWVWQYVVMIAFSGVVFGWVRYRTNSTLAAALTHSAYNTGQFVVFLLQNA